MDIRSLIDSDASGTGSRASATSSESRREPVQHFKSPQDIHQELRDRNPAPQRIAQRSSGIEPPQPPPIRPPPPNDFRSPSASSYSSAQSPYQKTPSSALSTGQYPFPQPPPHHFGHTVHSAHHHQHEGQTFAINTTQQTYGQPVSLPQTPTSSTPGSAFPSFQHHRPPSSHSASTPTSGHAQTPTFLRDSPQQSHAQVRGQYVSNSNQQYVSQPGTPLGPPTTLGRQTSSIRRESPGSYDHKRVNSGGNHGQHQQGFPSPNNTLRSHSGPSPTAYAPTHVQSPSHQDNSFSQERERSLSVSPKTRIPSQPYSSASATTFDLNRTPIAQVTSAKRKMGDSRMDETVPEQQPSAKRSMSLGVGGMLNTSHDDESHRVSRVKYNKYPQVPPPSAATVSHGEREPAGETRRSPLSFTPSHGATPQVSYSTGTQQPPTNPPPTEHHAPSPGIKKRLLFETYHAVDSVNSGSAPVIPAHSVSGHSKNLSPGVLPDHGNNKPTNTSKSFVEAQKRGGRYREVPIFAQSARQKGRGVPQVNGQRQLVGKSKSLVHQHPPKESPLPPTKQETNGHGVPQPGAMESGLDPAGLLGPWEPSITNVIPAEELTREIMNYLFGSVVQMNGVVFGPAGGTSTDRGAVVEIEAKIGQIIDKNTNDRLRLPVMTECLLSRTDPNLRTAFRSSMTAAQHSRLNAFLNQALTNSKPAPPGEPPKKPRVPLTYIHTRETDRFYDLSQNAINALPPSVQAYLDRRNKPKVRITTDQKTGQEMAKIIKVRVSDIEVYSPQTPFDWRVSVSLEVNYDGDMRELVETTEGKDQKRPDRNKDRVSYKHSHYQIDLTQVKAAEVNSKVVEKEHELEIEVSSAAVREQGLLVSQRQPNKYEELIRGFVDNVRTLVRHCPRDQ